VQEVPEAPKKSRKKLYSIVAVAAAVILIAVVALVLFLPSGLGETIPYSFSYKPGEKLAYVTNITMSSNTQSVTETGTTTIDVLSFDGEIYTVNETVGYAVYGMSQQYSFTLMMNKHGQVINSSGIPSEVQQAYPMLGNSPGFGMFINRTEVREGETVTVPLNTSISVINMTGTMYFKFGVIQNYTVTGGTFKTFRTDLTTDNIYITSNGGSMTANMNGQFYMEYGTCKLVDAHIEETASGSASGQSIQMTLTMQMTLTQDLLP
jgi:hypothetical protein